MPHVCGEEKYMKDLVAKPEEKRTYGSNWIGETVILESVLKQVTPHELDLTGSYDWRVRQTVYIYIYI